jgi:hypothetical protein
VLDEALLDDADQLAEADSSGLLRAAAAAGAQVRSTAESIAESRIADWAGMRPRALVFVSRPGVGPAAVGLVAALLPESCPVPVIVSDVVPSWVGALDVVFAHCDEPADPILAESLAVADRRGAHILLSAPPDGPVAAAGAGSAVLLPPRVDVPPRFAFPRVFAGGLALLDVLGLLRADLWAMADALDAEAHRSQPSSESFVNPAKALALRLAERTPLLWGVDRAGTALAHYAGYTLAAHAGVISDVAGYQQAVTRPALHRAAVSSASGADIFADPDEDMFGDGPLLRVLLLAVDTAAMGDPSRQIAENALPGADLLDPASQLADDQPFGGGRDGDSGMPAADAASARVTPATFAAVIALRFEMAGLYLGFAAGKLGGPGRLTPAAR